MSREIMEQALEALRLVGKYTDSLTCYASTISEHEANIVDPSVQLAIAALEAELAKPEQGSISRCKECGGALPRTGRFDRTSECDCAAEPEQEFSVKDCPQPELCHGKKCEYCRDMEKAEQESEPVYIMGHYVGNGKAVSAECGLPENSFREARRIIRRGTDGFGFGFPGKGYEGDAPPKRKWQGLTEDEIADVWANCKRDVFDFIIPFARAIEAKLREKNI